MDYTEEQLAQGIRAAVAQNDIAAANELGALADKLYPPQQIEATPIADGLADIGGRMGALPQEFLDKKKATTDQFYERVTEKVLGGKGYGSDINKIAGAAVEYAGGRAWDAATTFIPQEVQDTASSLIGRGLTASAEVVQDFLEKHPEAMEGVRYLEGKYSDYQEWARENPDIVSDFEDIFDVTSAMTPSTKVGPVLDTTLGAYGKRIKRKGVQQSIDEKRAGVREMVYPEDKIGEGITTEGGLPLRSREYAGSMREEEIAEALLISDVVDPSRTYNYNQEKVFEHVNKTKKELDKTIRRDGNPKIDIQEVLDEISLGLEDLQNIPGAELVVGNAETMAKNFLTTAQKIFSSLGDNPTALQVLNARRTFDATVKKARGTQFDASGDKETVISLVNKLVRDSLNQSVMKALPNSDIYHSLRHQHLLLSGYDTLRKRMKDERQNVLSRAWANVMRVSHLPSTPLALGATIGAAGTLLGGPVGLTLGLGVGGGMVGYGALKGLSSPTNKKALGNLLTYMNEAIKKSENSMMIETLKADRLAVIEMMREAAPEEERTPLKGAGNAQ